MIKIMKYRILYLLLNVGLFVFAQLKNNPCLSNSSCGDCIRASGECAFCQDKNFTNGDNATSRISCNYAPKLKVLGCNNITNTHDECGLNCKEEGIPKSPTCNNHGTLKCGICHCDEGRFGEFCQCSTEQTDDSKCRKDGDIDVVCSGAGSCICGKCECNRRLNKGEIIDGKFCECNNYGCDRYNGKLCGGVDRGSCVCGRCKCTEAYLGDNCGNVNCTIHEKNCYNQDGIKCSGHGLCNCDTCNCEKGYDGKFCENCVSCPTKCTEYKDCVQCTVWSEGPLAEGNKCDECKKFNIKVVNETDTVCEYKDDKNCFYHFKFEQNPDGNEAIIVQINKRCTSVHTKPTTTTTTPLAKLDTKSTPVLAIVLGMIGSLLLLAVILFFLWKRVFPNSFRALPTTENQDL